MNVIKRGGREMTRSITFDQITLLTDGHSNQGISPEEAARQAAKHNITVNVIGITDEGSIGEQGALEVKRIAEAGGGLHQIVPLEKIAKTVQMVTRQAMNKTMKQVIHAQLLEIFGKDELSEISPVQRVEIANMMDHMAEHSDLNILLLIDKSASMLRKMKKLEEAILDFQLSLLSRSGHSLLSIITFPGNNHNIEINIPWTNQIDQISKVVYDIKPKGYTPTGPAIQESVLYFNKIRREKTGVLDEYVI